MSKPCPVVVPFMIYENLGFVFQAAEGPGMEHPVAVALEFRAQVVPGLGVGASVMVGAPAGPWREVAGFPGFQIGA